MTDYALLGQLIFMQHAIEYWEKFGRPMRQCSVFDLECHRRILEAQREYYAKKHD